MLKIIIMIKIIIKSTENFLKKPSNSLIFCQRINPEGTEFCLNGFSSAALLGRVVMNENLSPLFDYC